MTFALLVRLALARAELEHSAGDVGADDEGDAAAAAADSVGGGGVGKDYGVDHDGFVVVVDVVVGGGGGFGGDVGDVGGRNDGQVRVALLMLLLLLALVVEVVQAQLSHWKQHTFVVGGDAFDQTKASSQIAADQLDSRDEG